jgi:hypothetical protein
MEKPNLTRVISKTFLKTADDFTEMHHILDGVISFMTGWRYQLIPKKPNYFNENQTVSLKDRFKELKDWR